MIESKAIRQEVELAREADRMASLCRDLNSRTWDKSAAPNYRRLGFLHRQRARKLAAMDEHCMSCGEPAKGASDSEEYDTWVCVFCGERNQFSESRAQP